MDSPSLDAAMARLADGDRAEFAPVFRELWPRVRSLCGSLLRNESDADDAAQQAMEKIFSRADQYDRERPALPWALAIAAWECRTLARWRGRRREVEGLESDVPALGPSVEAEFAQRELREAALAALGELRESDRQVLIDQYWNELESGAPAARKRRQRALERLRVVFRRLHGTE